MTLLQIRYEDTQVTLEPGESVLDGLLRSGRDLPHGCRSGVCRACTMVCSEGELPPEAAAALEPEQRAAGMFLACQCRAPAEPGPESAAPKVLHVQRDPEEQPHVPATLEGLERLSPSVMRVRVRPDAAFAFEAGQYVALRRADGVTRSYSIASLPGEDCLEFHVRRVPNGRMSGWLFDEAEVGARVAVSPPLGTCRYPAQPDAAYLDSPMLLVGVGTGLGPIWGIVRAAFEAGHRAPITLVQAGRTLDSLYLGDELDALSAAHPGLDLRRCVLEEPSEGESSTPLEVGAVDALAPRLVRDDRERRPGDWLALLCGDASVVHRLRRSLFLAGLSARRIRADAFG
ncbi:2Fe-2S iron-sulfur cluster-binding protein [Plesiocystis pacifica]|uniref:2Fe-2S iron-sulfur cluster-binding protein n=1 Tax=Plesiocystis pacifica TaxID=191768 RepID=UPI00030F3D61|nr:2Fe-2S iron-sulfur cluster-binding protein [Plesiocystis pacifica]